MRSRFSLLAVVAVWLWAPSVAQAVPFVISYQDADGEGFFDPVRGPERRAAFEFAVARWETVLDGTVPITITAAMPSGGGGSGAGAFLASAGAVSIHRNFGGLPDTWYGAALGSQIAGRDLNGPDNAEITIFFNADIDNPDVLGSVSWYYGTDAAPGFDIDMVTVALHEIGHGLGFFSLVALDSDQWQSPSNEPAIFDRMLFRPQVGPLDEMRPGERRAAVVSPFLTWVGPAVVAFNGIAPSVFTPDPPISGSSVAHWDPESAPGELMVPSPQGAIHDLGLLLPALVDMGWEIAIPSPTPRYPSATPTPTATATRPPFPAATPAVRRDFIYVANFDDDTVSVFSEIDSPEPGVRHEREIRVGNGPVGVAASADGRRVYVTNFHVGTMSVISTRRAAVVATVPVGASANGVAVTPDGRTIVVSDTFRDEAVVIDGRTLEVLYRLDAGMAPGAVAVGPSDLVFVAAYGEPLLTVIDLDARIRRALLHARQSRVLGLAFAESGVGYAVGEVTTDAVTRVDGIQLTTRRQQMEVPGAPQTIAVQRDGSKLYVAGGTLDQVVGFDEQFATIRRISTGAVPDSMALSSDGRILYVTNSGANQLAIVDADRVLAAGAMDVGAAPMGVAVAAVPALCDGDCNGDGIVPVDELIQALNIALGTNDVEYCSAADHDDDWRVTVNEIVLATTSALVGCSSQPHLVRPPGDSMN